MTTNTLAPLNQGQQEAANAFFQFLFSEDKEFAISGPGGTGKTHLMSHLIDTILPNYFSTCKMMGVEPQFDSVKMTATTNKAAEVVAVATGRPTDTIHSFLNLKVEENYSTGETKLIPTRNWEVHNDQIIFVDESSMIDTPLETKIHEGTERCKIVYVGDHCQLAPVKEQISPIYRRTMPFYHLTEQMRNNNQPALMAVCQQLRDTVETNVFQPIKIVPGVIDLLDDAQMQTQLQADFSSQTHSSRILAYTNNRVMQFNDHIRTIRQLPDEYQVGEFLVNNNSLQLKNRMLSVEEELTVLRVEGSTEKIQIEPGVELEIRRMDLESRIGDILFNIPVPVDRPHYHALLAHYRKVAKKGGGWGRFFDLKNKYPDLRQRDAATVHKSQGSTYDSVYIDLGNISTCNIPNQVARMLYVAFSRPRTRIYLYGDLVAKYGGLIH